MSEPARVSIRDLRFGWARDEALLDIDQLDIAAGDRVFLRGPSGSGKSTLLNLIAGVLEPQQGELEVCGSDLRQCSARQRDRIRADHIGFVFQIFNLLPYLGVIDNVTLPCRFSRRRQERAVGNDGSLEDSARRLLAGLGLEDPRLQARPVTELSVGQQQRVAAARALMGAPELVIADEPTSALDHDAREGFIRLLFSECDRAGSALLFVSHDRSLEPLFPRVIALDEINAARVAQ